MKILLVDDEKHALKALERLTAVVCPDAQVFCFQKASDALLAAQSEIFDIALLDIQLCGMNGVVLAKNLKDLMPRINIIFCTAYSEYAMEALKLHASGYLLKPISEEALRTELLSLRHPVVLKSKSRIFIRTFGNFDVFCNGEPVSFVRSKSKEVFAYLVDCRGTTATTSEIASIIWEDGLFDRARQKQLQTIISDLRKSLRAVGAENIIIKNKSGLMLDKSQVDCDFYRIIDGDAAAINSYTGKYMVNYSWAEFTTGFLDMIYF